jgi:hypothetical protein
VSNSKTERLVAIEFNGFFNVPAGTRLLFMMRPEVLEVVNTCAPRVGRARADFLLALIVGEEIDPNAPIFVEVNIVERSSTFYGPLTFEYGPDKGLAITCTQDEAAMADEVKTVLVEILGEAGN